MPESQRLEGGFFGETEEKVPQAVQTVDSPTGEFFGERGSDSANTNLTDNNRAALKTVGPIPKPAQRVAAGPTKPPPVGQQATQPRQRKPVNKIQPAPPATATPRPAPPVFEPKPGSAPIAPPPGPAQGPATSRTNDRPAQPANKAPKGPWEDGSDIPNAPKNESATARPSIPDPYAEETPQPTSRKDRLTEKRRSQAQRREERWARTRLAVPYHTDGPKLTFAALWFAAVFSSILFSPFMTVLITAAVAAMAGMQTAQAWFGRSPARWWCATAAAVTGFSGYFGGVGLIAGAVVASVVLGIYMLVGDEHERSGSELFDVLIRSALPAGIAAGGIVAVAQVEQLAAVGLVLMISAYESGDYLVGSGSTTAAEGPIAGFISLSVMAFVLAMVVPAPYTVTTVVAFAVISAIGALAGQIFASAALPRGVAWAPALRRLDSYVITAPIWLLLVVLLTPA